MLRTGLGSTRAVVDEQGELIESYDYYPFGLQMPGRVYKEGQAVTKNLFTNKELDSETKNYYFGARYYDPAIARWLSVDPRAFKKSWLSPYVYCSNNPKNRFDPDGREDWLAFTKSSFGLIGSIGGIGTGFGIMVASGTGEAVSLGGLSIATIPAFLIGNAIFTAGIIGAEESFANMETALETPDGMTAKDFSIVKEVVKGFGGSKTTQESAKLLFDAVGLKGTSKLTEKGLMHLISILQAAGATSEDIINFLLALEEKEEENQQQDNNQQSDSDNNNDDSDDNNDDDDEEKKKTDNSWWDDYDPSKW